MQPYLTLDTAYWDPKVLDAAAWINQQQAAAGRQERVEVIFFYLFDQFLSDVNGYCGGWTPDVVALIEDRGYIAAPIVTMRPGVAGGMLAPQEITAALDKYPALTRRPVHIKIAEDQEDGSFTGAAWSQGLAATVPTELYGLASTVLSGYSSGVAAIWIGNYPGIGVLPPPDLAHIPGVPDSAWADARAWQYVGSASVAGADVDVSISNVPLDTAPPIDPPPPVEESDMAKQALVYAKSATYDQQHFVYLAPSGPGQGVLYHRVFDNTAGKTYDPIEVSSVPLAESAGLSAELMAGPTSDNPQLHVFCRFADTSKATGAHFWLDLPYVPGTSAWGSDSI